jgi:hypothetical protein
MENKIVHFSDDFTINDINEAMSHQDDILYFSRLISEKNEFHIVNYKKGNFQLTPFISQLLNFYKKDEKISKILSESVKIKGNDAFTIIYNVNDELANQLKNDLNNLLKK